MLSTTIFQTFVRFGGITNVIFASLSDRGRIISDINDVRDQC